MVYLINDAAHKLRLYQQPAVVHRMAAEGVQHGIHVVSVHWQTGEAAIMPCPVGSTWPDPDMIVAAYQGCRAMRKPAASDTS